MIYLDINGRCGNQMFQYAFARKLMIINNISDLRIDFFHVDRWKQKAGGDDTYSDQLSFFNTVPYVSEISNGNNVLVYGAKKQIKLIKRYPLIRKISRHLKSLNLLAKYQNKLHLNGIYKEDELRIELVKSNSPHIFVRGYFENPMYFHDIRDILLEELAPKYPRKEKNKELYSVIDNEESVCVSFRVWNEIKYEKKFLKEHKMCSKEYYAKAIDLMHKFHPNAHFVVFSNDIEWVKKNIKFDYPVCFESGNDEIWEKMRLMYSCKHFIMSNSTFCWWAQYLCKNENKIVISPSKWRDDGSKSYLLMDEWIKIENE